MQKDLLMDGASIRSREQLIAAEQAGRQFKYLFFWGHQPSKDGRITASCFSQWFDSSFEVQGARYATAEHFMMAKKAELFGDQAARDQIMLAENPGKAKALGRSVKGFNEETWLEHRWSIVVEANFHKFSQSPALRSFLLGTSTQVLVEASPVDHIWGIGLDARSADANSPSSWQGLNLLGFALMEVRGRLVQSSDTSMQSAKDLRK